MKINIIFYFQTLSAFTKKALLTSTMALGLLVILGGNQIAKARGHNVNVYQQPPFYGDAPLYRGRPSCELERPAYYTRPGCNGYRPYVAPDCRLVCRHDFLANPYNCHPVCY